MPAADPVLPERAPRRGRYLIPRDTPRRTEVLAALTVAVLLVGFLFAQLTLVFAAVFHAISRVSRLSPVWLAAPAACGLIWVLAIGPEAALAGFGAAPSVVAALLARAVADPSTAAGLARIPATAAGRAAGQFPVALILAAGLAAAGWWLRWLHTSEWDLPEPRPGLASLCRRGWTAAFVRSGGVVTADGACLGVDLATGRPATVSWRDGGGGVLVTGEAPGAVCGSGFQLVHAAIRRRKPVIVVDLAANPELPAALAAVCGAAGAPLLVFGPAGGAAYDPLRDRAPATAAGLVTTMIDWGELPDPARTIFRDCLADACAVMTAAPGDPAEATLSEVAGMLRPGALRAAMARVPPWYPGRSALAQRVELAVSRLDAEAVTASLVAGQLAVLQESDLGRWLDPGTRARIDLEQVVRQRAVALFSMAASVHGRAADMIANLVAADIVAVYRRLRLVNAAGEGLAWFNSCDGAAGEAVAGLASVGAGTGFVPVLATTSPEVAGALAGLVSVCVVRRLGDRRLAAAIAPLTGTRFVPAPQLEPRRPDPQRADPWQPDPQRADPWRADRPAGPAWAEIPTGPGRADGLGPVPPFGMMRSPVVPADDLLTLGDDEFTLIAAGAGRPRRRGTPGQAGRVVARGRAIASRVAGPSRPSARSRSFLVPGRHR